jgi:hypothetical protein
VSPHHSCKATRSVTLDRGPYRVLSAGASRTLVLFEVVTPPPPPFSTGLGTGYGGDLSSHFLCTESVRPCVKLQKQININDPLCFVFLFSLFSIYFILVLQLSTPHLRLCPPKRLQARHQDSLWMRIGAQGEEGHNCKYCSL